MPSHAPASPDTAVSFKAGDRAVVLSTATGGINAGVPIGWVAEVVESREAGEFVGARLLADGRRIDFQIDDAGRYAKSLVTLRFELIADGQPHDATEMHDAPVGNVGTVTHVGAAAGKKVKAKRAPNQRRY
jgi:hypothetical protein